MEVLQENEMIDCTGGAKISASLGIVIGGIVSFVLGFFHGYSSYTCSR